MSVGPSKANAPEGDSMELVSVIIPTYNRSTCIIEAIDSVLGQSYSPIEIIVVDDGSTDNTAELINGYSNQVVYTYRENGGVSAARNHGISLAEGEFIAFLDSDDKWVADKIEKQVEWLCENSDFGMVLSDVFLVDSSTSVIEKTNRRLCLPRDGFVLEDILLRPSLIPSSVLVRRSVLQDVGVFDQELKTAEDLDLHLRIAQKYKIGLIEKPLVYVLRGADGLSQTGSTYTDHVFVLERFLEINKDKYGREISKKALFNVYLTASNGKYWRGEICAGFSYAVSALRNSINIGQILTSFRNVLKLFKYLMARG